MNDDVTTPLPHDRVPDPREDDPTRRTAPETASRARADEPPWAEPPTGTAASDSRGPRTGTIVGGLVLLLLGIGVLAIAAGATLDLQIALIVLLLITGSALLVGAALGARRRR